MPANANWSRWVFASVATYLKNIASTNGITMLVQGLDDPSDATMEAAERAEVRINGPYSQEVSQGCYRVWVDVNVLLVSQMGGSKKNAYDSEVNLGIFQNALDQTIPLYKYGTGPDDDQSHFDCLHPRVDKGDSIRVIRFGQVTPPDRIKQEMVDARFYTYLTN